MNQMDFFRPVPHSFDEIDQIMLIGMSRVAADRMDTSLDRKPFSIQKDITFPRSEPLNIMPRSPFG